MQKNLTTATGKSIVIESKPIAKGGYAGEVYKILSPRTHKKMCAKIYYKDKRIKKREQKLKYMIANPPKSLKSNNYIICWPKEALYENNVFVGFTMPLAFNGSISLYQLTKSSMNSSFGSNWRKKYDRNDGDGIKSRLKLITNLASAIHTVHQLQKYILADLKPDNVLVTDDGKVSLIDFDNIQISNNDEVIFYAEAASNEYMPPESKHINIKKDTVQKSWDRFSLAAIIYKIIFGIHPYTATFSGRYSKLGTPYSKIIRGLFVHGKNKYQIKKLPAPHKNFSIIPEDLKQLFFRAFETGHRMPDVRPSAEEWGEAAFKEIKKKDNKIFSNGFTKPTKKYQKRISSGNEYSYAIWIIAILGFVILIGLLFNNKSNEVIIESKDPTNKSEKIIQNPDSIKYDLAITTDYTSLWPDFKTGPIYFAYPKSAFRIINRNKKYIQISTSKGEMWINKEKLKIVNNVNSSFSDKYNNRIESAISKMGEVLADGISISKEPSVFSKNVAKLDSGDAVFVYRKAPGTIYLYIRYGSNNYYIMEDLVKIYD